MVALISRRYFGVIRECTRGHTTVGSVLWQRSPFPLALAGGLVLHANMQLVLVVADKGTLRATRVGTDLAAALPLDRLICGARAVDAQGCVRDGLAARLVVLVVADLPPKRRGDTKRFFGYSHCRWLRRSLWNPPTRSPPPPFPDQPFLSRRRRRGWQRRNQRRGGHRGCPQHHQRHRRRPVGAATMAGSGPHRHPPPHRRGR